MTIFETALAQMVERDEEVSGEQLHYPLNAFFHPRGKNAHTHTTHTCVHTRVANAKSNTNLFSSIVLIHVSSETQERLRKPRTDMF